MTDDTVSQKLLKSTMRFLAKTKSRPKKIRFGERLLQAGVISEEQLQQALAVQKKKGDKIGMALKDLGAISEADLHRFMAKHLGVDYVDLSQANLEPDTILLLKEVHARRHRALVLKSDKEGLLVGMADPTDIHTYDELSRLLRRPLRIALVSEVDLLHTIDSMYRRRDEIDALAAEVKQELSDGEIDIEDRKSVV